MLNNQKEIILLKDLGFKYLNSIRKDTGKQDRKSYALYRCYCGKEFEAFKSEIKKGKTKSCGCYKKELRTLNNLSHKMSKHRLYRTWNNMIQRCTNKNMPNYKDYGGRGIDVSIEWQDVNNFINDMDSTYSSGLELDRINNDLGYSKDNCRWSSRETNSQNTRKINTNNTTGYRGIYIDKRNGNYITKIVVSKKRFYLGTFDTAIEAAKAYDQYIIDNNLEHTKNF